MKDTSNGLQYYPAHILSKTSVYTTFLVKLEVVWSNLNGNNPYQRNGRYYNLSHWDNVDNVAVADLTEIHLFIWINFFIAFTCSVPPVHTLFYIADSGIYNAHRILQGKCKDSTIWFSNNNPSQIKEWYLLHVMDLRNGLSRG